MSGEAGLRRAGRPSAAERAAAAFLVAGTFQCPSAPGGQVTKEAAARHQRTEALERKIGEQQLALDFFSRSLAACQGTAPAERRAWRDSIYAMIQASVQQQGCLGIEQLCFLSGLPRSGCYRHWQANAPRQEEAALRDAIQRLSLADRKLGYRPILALLRREGWTVNHKRVRRIRQSDNLLCLRKRAFRPATTDSRHGHLIHPNLARKLAPTAVNHLWVADITYVRLSEEFVYLAVILDAFSRRVVGWAMADHLRAELALEALAMALAGREVIPGRLSVGQRDGEELHGDVEARGGGWPGVSRSGRRQGFDRRVFGRGV